MVNLHKKLGTSPFNLLGSSKTVRLTNFDIDLGIEPVKSLWLRCNSLRLRNSDINSGIGPSNLLPERSRNSSLGDDKEDILANSIAYYRQNQEIRISL